MTDDEHAIRELIETWMSASKAHDLPKVLSLMSDDVVFMVPGQKPFGKQAFAAASKAQQNAKIDGNADIQELRVLGDWAYLRNHISITITAADGSPSIQRSGYTLRFCARSPPATGCWRAKPIS